MVSCDSRWKVSDRGRARRRPARRAGLWREEGWTAADDHGQRQRQGHARRGTLPAGCRLTFTHKEKSYPATAEIAADGSYTLLFNGKPAVPTGNYEVAVLPPKDDSGPPPDPSNPEAYKQCMMNPRVRLTCLATKIIVPGKYADAAKSGLSCTVLEGQETVYDIALTSGN